MRGILRALSLGAAVVTSGASAGEQPRVLPQPSLGALGPAAAPGDLGSAIMSAMVGADGALLSGAGALASSRASAGIYFVTFGRDVTQCVFAVTSTNALGVTPVAQVSDPNLVAVYWYYDRNSSFIDAGFYIVAYCDR